MTTKKEAIQKLEKLRTRISEVEEEKDKAMEIMNPRFTKILNNEKVSMEEVRNEDAALRALHIEKDWRKDIINCIEYFFTGKSSQITFKERAYALNFSIMHNYKTRQGFSDAEKLIMDMIKEIDQFWSDTLVDSEEVEPPQIIKQLKWVRQQWHENKPLAIVALIIIIVTAIAIFL